MCALFGIAAMPFLYRWVWSSPKREQVEKGKGDPPNINTSGWLTTIDQVSSSNSYLPSIFAGQLS